MFLCLKCKEVFENEKCLLINFTDEMRVLNNSQKDIHVHVLCYLQQELTGLHWG